MTTWRISSSLMIPMLPQRLEKGSALLHLQANPENDPTCRHPLKPMRKKKTSEHLQLQQLGSGHTIRKTRSLCNDDLRKLSKLHSLMERSLKKRHIRANQKTGTLG